jgi:hypothetical protein
MPPSAKHRRAPAVIALLVGALLVVFLSACGGSSSSGAGTVKTTAGIGGRYAKKLSAVRKCLREHGVTPGNSGSKAGPTSPQHVSLAKLEAARKKCGAKGELANLGEAEASARPQAPSAGPQSAARFSECMRTNGVKLPQAGASASGPAGGGAAINTQGAAFKAAEARCLRELAPGTAAAAP